MIEFIMSKNQKHAAILKAIEITGSGTKLAALIHTSRYEISRLLNCKRNITPKMAARIEKATYGAVTKKQLLPTFNWD